MEESAQRTNRILSKTPKLKDELLAVAASGRLNILDQLGMSKADFESVECSECNEE